MATQGQHPEHLAALDGGQLLNGGVAIPFQIGLQTVTGTASYNFYDANGLQGPRGSFSVTRVYGIVTGGAGAGTVVLNHVDSTGTASAITDTANLVGLGLADTDQFDFTQIDDAYRTVSRGENLQVVTTANALCIIIADVAWAT